MKIRNVVRAVLFSVVAFFASLGVLPLIGITPALNEYLVVAAVVLVVMPITEVIARKVRRRRAERADHVPTLPATQTPLGADKAAGGGQDVSIDES